MKFFGYWVNGVCYGCTEKAKESAEKAAKEKGAEVYRKIYRI